MDHESFDHLTRALSTTTSRRQMLKVIVGTTMAWFGHELVAPQQVRAQSSNCGEVEDDGTCPSDSTKEPKDGNTPAANGCGPEGGSIKIPQGYGDADYTPGCNSHDFCYEDCQKSQKSCDDQFYKDLLFICAGAYPGIENRTIRNGCYNRAQIYAGAVSKFGSSAWAAAQKKACQCCSKVYCQCNNTCYNDVNVCLNECRVSLGCFSGICGPAEEGQCG